MLTFCFSMFYLHGFFSTMRTSNLVFNNCVLIGGVMVHGTILQYARSYIDIYSKITSILEENIDMILCVLLTHTTSITLQKDLTMIGVVVVGICQVFHQHSALHTLVIHFTLLTNCFNSLISTVLLDFQCTTIKFKLLNYKCVKG